jgi:hypothetical protein
MPVEYRYVIVEEKSGKIVAVEQGDRAHRFLCVSERERERDRPHMCLSVYERERERETVRACVFVCVCVRERPCAHVCLCVCVRERERERPCAQVRGGERESARENGTPEREREKWREGGREATPPKKP